MALRAYREYGRYLVELMRLPVDDARARSALARPATWTPTRSSGCGAKRRGGGPDPRGRRTSATTRRSPRASPTTACRSASSPTTRRSPSCSSCSASSASRGASSSSRGATCARSSGCCRRREMLALLDRLGLPQRRHPGPAVRGVDDAARPGRRRWPPRPVARSCRSRSGASRRSRLRGHAGRRRSTSPPDDPAELQRATQAMADALAATIAAAPEQWYSFKPIWPAERRRGRGPRAAGRRHAGGPIRPGTAAAACRATRPTARTRAVARVTLRTRVLIAASVAGLPSAGGPADRSWPTSPARSGTALAPSRAAQARRNLARVCRGARRERRGSAAARAAAHDPTGARAPGPRCLPAPGALLPRGGADAGAARRRPRRPAASSRRPRSSTRRSPAAGP